MWLQRAMLLWMVALVGVGGLLGWYVYSSLAVPSDEALRLQVYAVASQFRAEHQPRALVHVDKLLGHYPKSLIRYSSLLPTLHRPTFADSAAWIRFKARCQTAPLPKLQSLMFQKALAWESFLCGRLKQLRSSFFHDPPYIHPLGHSYIYRAWKLRRAPFQTRTWLQKHWRWAHILELSELLRGLRNLGASWSVLSQLKWQDLQEVLQGRTLVVTPNMVLIKEVAAPPTTSRSYRVFRRSEFSQFLHRKHLLLQVGAVLPAKHCLLRQGRLCWQVRGRNSSLWGVLLGVVLFALCLGLLAHLVSSQIRRLLERQRLQKRHSFLIQTLTHELRTPTTALQLVVDAFRKDFDDMPESSQMAFLRMCQEHQKLKRVIHASQQYLQSNLDGHTVALQEAMVPSLAKLVETIVTDWQEEKETPVRVDGVVEDCAIVLDRYWFKVCLTNLLSNALLHGKPPIVVSLRCEGSKVQVAVQDQGFVSPELPDLLQPFYKGAESSGLGLGLGIVEHVVREMGGSLSLRSEPTTFVITLERKT